jgi:hypothetical protein
MPQDSRAAVAAVVLAICGCWIGGVAEDSSSASGSGPAQCRPLSRLASGGSFGDGSPLGEVYATELDCYWIMVADPGSRIFANFTMVMSCTRWLALTARPGWPMWLQAGRDGGCAVTAAV